MEIDLIKSSVLSDYLTETRGIDVLKSQLIGQKFWPQRDKWLIQRGMVFLAPGSERTWGGRRILLDSCGGLKGYEFRKPVQFLSFLLRNWKRKISMVDLT